MQGLTSTGGAFNYPTQIKMFSVSYNETVVKKVYFFNEGIMDVPIFEFFSISNDAVV